MTSLSRWCLLASLTAIFLLSLSPVRLDDLFMYLALGKDLVGTGTLPAVDPYIFTIPDYQWHVWHEWLSYLIYYGVFLSGGYEGVLLLRAVLISIAALMIWKTGLRARLPLFLIPVFLAIAAIAAAPRFLLDRSSLFSDLLTVFLLFSLTHTQAREGFGRWKWALPLLFLVWVQLHPGFVLGWVVLGLFLASSWLQWNGQQRLQWGLVSLSCVLICFLNPVGFEAIRWPVQNFLSADWNFFRQSNSEWIPTLSTSFLSGPYKVFLCSLMAITLILTGLRIRKEGLFQFGAALMLAYLGLSATRFVGLSGIGMVILTIQSLGPFANRLAFHRLNKFAAFSFLLPILGIGLSFSDPRLGLRLLLSKEPLHEVVPSQAVEVLRSLPPGHVFNQWETGSFLVWELGKRQKIAAHGFVSDTGLAQKYYHRFSYSPQDWNEIINQNQVAYFFMRRQTFEEHRAGKSGWISEFETDRWKLVHADRAAVIFQHNQK